MINPLTLQASLQHNKFVHQVSTLVDFGADGNFMDIDLVNQGNIPIYPLKDPISASTLCGTLSLGLFTSQTCLPSLSPVIMQRGSSYSTTPPLPL